MRRRAIIIILDGLRRDSVSRTRMPCLAAFARSATRFTNHRSVFPSTTRVASASLATGCSPGRHGLVGNSMALQEPGGLVVHDAGHPDYLQHKRRVTGNALDVPTLAERTKDIGGSIVFSNVSPGAAYAQDPDGHGYVYHRAGSFGPGRQAVPESDHLKIGAEIDGDRVMTERFINEVVHSRQPAVGTLWLGHPDTSQHDAVLGSPAHLIALADADRHAGMVINAVSRLWDRGEDILLVVGSDHGHHTIAGEVDVAASLVDAGLKASDQSTDVMVADNGSAALVYLDPYHRGRAGDIVAALEGQPWIDRVVGPEDLPSVGLSADNGLAVAIAMRSWSDPNLFGVGGISLVAKHRNGNGVPIGCGQHGGLGVHEQSPVLLIAGPGFACGVAENAETSITDIAPTVLEHLELPLDGMDGRSLQSITTH